MASNRQRLRFGGSPVSHQGRPGGPPVVYDHPSQRPIIAGPDSLLAAPYPRSPPIETFSTGQWMLAARPRRGIDSIRPENRPSPTSWTQTPGP